MCLYRPPEGNREPTKQEIEGCAPILDRLIERLNPKLIISLGDLCARRYGFKGSVGSMVGKFKVDPATGTIVTVVYHPAFAARWKGTQRFAEIEAQTLEVIQEAVYRASGERKVEQHPYMAVDVALVYPNQPTAIDTESHGALDARLTTLDSVQVYEGGGPVRIGPSLLAGPHHPFIFHNAIHDLIVLARHGSPQRVVKGDTMVAAWMLGRQNLSLKGLAWRELGANVIDYEEAAAAGGEVWLNYAAQDPVLTWRLHEKLYPELVSQGCSWLYDNVEMPLQPILAHAALTGFMVDHERVMSLWSAFDRRMELLEQRMRHLIGSDFNPRSPQQVLKALRERGINVPNTNSKTLAQYIKDEFVQYLLAHRKASKRISTYLIKLSMVNTVSGMFNPCGAQTGRLSQSSWNLMNLPGDIKRCLRARPGYIFIYRDYSQIEVRLAAFYSMDEYLLGALREGRNIHEELCISVFGYRVPELYTRAKSANFERLYAGSLETRAQALGVSPSFLKQREKPWKGFDAWAENQKREAHRTGVARTFMGRMMVLHGIDSSDKFIRDKAEKQAINMPEQGGASDIAKRAMVIADPWMRQLGGYVLHQEHDSILAEVPVHRAKEADEALDQAMTQAVPEEIWKVVEIPSKSIISNYWG